MQISKKSLILAAAIFFTYTGCGLEDVENKIEKNSYEKKYDNFCYEYPENSICTNDDYSYSVSDRWAEIDQEYNFLNVNNFLQKFESNLDQYFSYKNDVGDVWGEAKSVENNDEYWNNIFEEFIVAEYPENKKNIEIKSPDGKTIMELGRLPVNFDEHILLTGDCEDFSLKMGDILIKKGVVKRENLFLVMGNSASGGGHIWLEFRLDGNIFIFDNDSKMSNNNKIANYKAEQQIWYANVMQIDNAKR